MSGDGCAVILFHRKSAYLSVIMMVSDLVFLLMNHWEQYHRVGPPSGWNKDGIAAAEGFSSWTISEKKLAADRMEGSLRSLTDHMNGRMAEMMSLPEGKSFIDEEGRISMRMFMQERGGKLSEEAIIADERYIYEKKTDVIARSPGTLRYFGGVESAYRHMEESRRSRDGELGEKAFFYVMNRLLGRRYLVLRTSIYDDLENKADFLIVDLKKWKCGPFVVDMLVNDAQEHSREALLSRKKEILSGREGNHVKYGVSRLKEGGVSRCGLDGLPGIVIPVGLKAIKSFYDDLAADRPFDAEPTDAEWRLFEYAISSFADHLPRNEDLMTEKSIPLLEFLQLAQNRLENIRPSAFS